MVTRRHRVARIALLSVVVTSVLTLVWEFFFQVPVYAAFGWREQPAEMIVQWGHVLTTILFSAIAVVVMSILALRLIRELRAKDDAMRQKNEEMLTFSADMAHELRTPLAVLQAHMDAMDAGGVPTPLREDVSRITRIVEQVLAKSRIEAIEVQPDEQADLSEICSFIATYLAPLVIKEGRSIALIGAEQPVLINGNSFALEQAVRNLVENAIKYSSRDSTITIEVTPEPSIRVIDTGRGVPAHAREQIFERFHRADRRSNGSGLGLPIVRRVAEAHGGSVTVEDAPAGGAVFVLRFPKTK